MGSRTARLGGALLALVLTGPVEAGTAAAPQPTSTVRATADATVSETAPRARFGRERTLIVSGSPELRSYLRFTIPRDTRVVDVKLRLYAVTTRPATVVVRAVRGRWSERSLTFARAPRASKPAVRLRVRRGGWVSADVDRLVRGRVVQLVLETASRRAVVFVSREVRARAPRLVLQREAPPAERTVTIAAAGNVACDPLTPAYNGGAGTADACRMRQTSDVLLSQPFDAVLALGDNQYECGSLSAYQQVFHPTWGRVKSLIRPVLGNHDYASPLPGTACDPSQQPNGYFAYFGAAAGPQPAGYYSFDLGPWHVVALNSNCARVPGGCGAGSPQEQWLRRDLAADARGCTLAFMHHPRVSSSYSANVAAVQPLWQALYDARADVVLAGHDHLYERLAPINPAGQRDDARGLRQFVVGTGGFSHHPFFAVHPASEARNNDTFGVLKLVLSRAGYSWQFLPEAGKTFTDAGRGACR